MPNYCSNVLTVLVSDATELDSIVKELTGTDEDLSFEVVTHPEREDKEEYASEEARILAQLFGDDDDTVRWGTRSDAYDVTRLHEGTQVVEYSFTTSWSPPTMFVRSYSEKHPKAVLHLAWLEEGNGLMGAWYVSDGHVVLEQEDPPGNHLVCRIHDDRDDCLEEDCYDYLELEVPTWWHFNKDLAEEFSG